MSAPSWSRYGSRVRRRCARAGCNAPAVATLRFEPTERLAWLAELDESAARTQGDLCQRHAAALVLPRGWALHDERISAQLGSSDDAQSVDAPAAEFDVAEAPIADAAPTENGADTGEEASAEVEPPAVAPNSDGVPSVPAVFRATDPEALDEAVTDELDTILDARTPLLQRA